MVTRICAYLRLRHRANVGFTLVETLMALIILVIMTGIVAMGIPVAFETYTKAVDGSNAQVLLTTTTNELRNELSMAQDHLPEGDGTVKFYLTADGYWASLENSTDKGILKHIWLGQEPGKVEADGSPFPLVSVAAQTYAVNTEGKQELLLRTKFDAITYSSDGVFTISGLQVISGRGESAGTVLASVGDGASGAYKVRAITY